MSDSPCYIMEAGGAAKCLENQINTISLILENSERIKGKIVMSEFAWMPFKALPASPLLPC